MTATAPTMPTAPTKPQVALHVVAAVVTTTLISAIAFVVAFPAAAAVSWWLKRQMNQASPAQRKIYIYAMAASFAVAAFLFFGSLFFIVGTTVTSS